MALPDLRIDVWTSPPPDVVAASVEILRDAFAPDEGGAVTAADFMAPAPGRALVSASAGGDLVGFARVDRREGAGLLAWLAVASGARSSGIGKRLIARSADVLADDGATTMFIECRVDDFYAPRRRFYERNGARSVSGGDYWLESHTGELIQYDLLLRPLTAGRGHRDEVTAGAISIHEGGAGRRPERLATALAWTLR